MALTLICNAFANGGEIPKLFSCEGADLSPSLEWTGQPRETKSFALIVDDPDAPGGVWTHWLLWDIPTSVQTLAQGFKPGQVGQSGTNDFGKPGYGGPCPPKGHGPHRYFFRLYALGEAGLGAKAGAKRADVDRALRSRVLAEAQYIGRYERR
jgi:Raf kinase inhibitor-like YbhB/YbcL family protein